jgi:hypothetical protein
MKVFTVSGKARHGKSTVGEFIKEYYESKGHKVCVIAFARHIKAYAKEFFGWDGREETKPRDFLNEIGTDLIRIKMGRQMFHINRTVEDIEVLSHYFDVFIVADARVVLEVETMKEKFNAINIRVERPNFESDLTSEQKNYCNETALDNYDKFDYYIENDGTLEDLKDKVNDLLKVIE